MLIFNQFQTTSIFKRLQAFRLTHTEGKLCEPSPLPSPPCIVTHPLFFCLSLFGNVSSFLLNSLKLLAPMTDVDNICHMLASLWSASSSRLCL